MPGSDQVMEGAPEPMKSYENREKVGFLCETGNSEDWGKRSFTPRKP